jgi:hypothetical protein
MAFNFILLLQNLRSKLNTLKHIADDDLTKTTIRPILTCRRVTLSSTTARAFIYCTFPLPKPTPYFISCIVLMVTNDLRHGLYMSYRVCGLAWPAAAASYASGYCTSGGCGVWNPWRLLGAGWAWKRPGSFKQARQTHELCARAGRAHSCQLI